MSYISNTLQLNLLMRGKPGLQFSFNYLRSLSLTKVKGILMFLTFAMSMCENLRLSKFQVNYSTQLSLYCK